MKYDNIIQLYCYKSNFYLKNFRITIIKRNYITKYPN